MLEFGGVYKSKIQKCINISVKYNYCLIVMVCKVIEFGEVREVWVGFSLGYEIYCSLRNRVDFIKMQCFVIGC